MDLQLTGKTVFISGSTSGIGHAIAKRFIEEGATVVINGRTEASVEKAISELKTLYPAGSVLGIAADFSKADDVDKLINALPHIDILVNNVGIFEPVAFENIKDEDWFRFFEVNVMSGVRLSRYLFPKMIAQNWGRIIFISSESAIFIPQEMIHYGMTKTAQLAVSRGLAELTKGTGVTVNTIMPGPTKSAGAGDFLANLAKTYNVTAEEAEQGFFKTARPTSLLQRFANVDEVATTVVYYCSPLASATNGAAIRVEGGLVKSIV
ncbi:MAG TPA: SDR family oxidoreductase [Chitinophagaceae bacterium]|nr:SDR family oxidoreductase [Chitinophagaceae bacterium]